MENKIQVFTNEKFGKVRTLNEGGKIYFVASDIAKRLGYTNLSKAVNDHCRWVTKRYIPHPQGNGSLEVNIIPEGDVYRLITHSKLPTAERFEKWVFDEVLPSIRKTGGYTLPDFTNPIEAARAWADECEAKQKALAQVNEMKPKAEFYDDVTGSEDTIDIGEVAKVLHMGIGRNKLFQFLRDKKVLAPNNAPYQRFIDAGYFRRVESSYEVYGTTHVSVKTVVFQRGVDYIRKLLKESA
ncbi:phage antirepressor Ant [Veillonellaceae bacterium WCA-693-APC-5D-A]|uniref:Phage antirepressor Ant n=1 Tax=Anaerovibrio slackiae TaxID=2652309 RepID=A0A6I2UHI3_9FIRM|nr:phage antirepressor KilAC domain-containing protein [Anaerovibrio slackiae]MSU08236.1 phage antirepressor Ant [Anaerovibrio slackiae]